MHSGPITPWRRSRPAKVPRTKLTSRSKARARASARKAGRRYPNLVDNMQAARKGTLPPLQDQKGCPTRFALTAAAWGEPVPKTPRAARKIAAKGRRLLKGLGSFFGLTLFPPGPFGLANTKSAPEESPGIKRRRALEVHTRLPFFPVRGFRRSGPRLPPAERVPLFQQGRPLGGSPVTKAATRCPPNRIPSPPWRSLRSACKSKLLSVTVPGFGRVRGGAPYSDPVPGAGSVRRRRETSRRTWRRSRLAAM
jgi:hypothetical protein